MIKLFIKKLFLLIVFSFIFCQEYSINNKIRSSKVDLGIASITKVDSEYIIGIYGINPFNEIAGIQFKMIPTDLFTILGFSLVGNTIGHSSVVIGPNMQKENILVYIKAKPTDKLIPGKYILNLEYVLASKKGKTLSADFTPINFEINKEGEVSVIQ